MRTLNNSKFQVQGSKNEIVHNSFLYFTLSMLLQTFFFKLLTQPIFLISFNTEAMRQN